MITQCAPQESIPKYIHDYNNGITCLEQVQVVWDRSPERGKVYLACAIQNLTSVVFHRILQTSVDKDISNPMSLVFYNLGIAYYYKDTTFYDTAYRYFKTSMRCNKKDDGLNQAYTRGEINWIDLNEYMSVICMHLNLHEEAIIYLKRWLDDRPSTLGYFQLANVYVQMGELDLSRSYIDLILETDDDHPDMLRAVYELLIAIYERKRDPEFRAAHNIKEEPPREEIISYLEAQLEYINDPDEQMEKQGRLWYEQAKLLEPTDPSEAIMLYKDAWCHGYKPASGQLLRLNEDLECE